MCYYLYKQETIYLLMACELHMWVLTYLSIVLRIGIQIWCRIRRNRLWSYRRW